MTNCSSSLVEYQLPAKLPEELRGRKLVGIGEVVHGSGGLHKLAGSLIQKMVTDFNVRIILFEAPQAAIAKINEHIVRGEPVPASLLSDLYFVWKSQDNLQLFNKLSELNRSLKEKVQIIGIDIRQPSVDLVQIREYLIGANKADLLESFPVKRAAVLEFAEYEKSVLNKKVMLADDLADSLTNVFEKIDIEIGADRTKSKAEKAQLALSIIKLKAWVKTYKFLGREGGYNQGFLARDEGMANVAKSYLDGNSVGPAIIWAHLGHLAFNNQTIQSTEEFLSAGKLLGALLRQEFGSSYSLIAVMAKKTGVALADGKTVTFEAKANSLESKALNKSTEVYLLGPKELGSLKTLMVGDTTNADHVAKQTYLKLKMGSLDQFDYAAIVGEASAMEEVR